MLVAPGGLPASQPKLCSPTLASPAAVLAGAVASGRPLPRSVAQAADAKDAEPPEKALVKSLTAKLSQVERLNKVQAAKLARQSQEIDQLRAELQILQRQTGPSPRASEDGASEDGGSVSGGEAGTGGASGSAAASLAKQVRKLRAQRDHFKQQVADMTKFLEDYGLTWVGEGEAGGDGEEGDEEGAASESAPAEAPHNTSGEAAAGEASSPASPSHRGSPSPKSGRLRTPMTWNVDIDQMKDRVDGLNATVEKTGARVVSDRVGGAVHARLVADDALPLPLTFFKDGVKLGDCPFQAFHEQPAQHLLRDILDGYFPYILKDKYPDGVLLRVVDRMAHGFEDWLRDHADSDPDLADGGARLLPALGRAIRGPTGGAGQRGQRAGDLAGPEKVLRAGQICEGPGLPLSKASRAGTAGHRGSSAPVRDRGPPQGEVSLLEEGRDPTAPTVHLQVKLESGQRVVLRMEPSHTVGDLEDALERWRTGGTAAVAAAIGEEARAAVGEGPRLLLQSAFPRRSYGDRAQTLADAGLAPSATLFVASAGSNG